MTNKEFEEADAELMTHADGVLLNRATMYAKDTDRLANFKETAAMVGLTPEKVCEVYLHKALSAMIKILHGAPAVGETVLDRFSDPLNYVRLAYALVREKQGDPKQVFLFKSLSELTLQHAEGRGRALNRYVD